MNYFKICGIIKRYEVRQKQAGMLSNLFRKNKKEEVAEDDYDISLHQFCSSLFTNTDIKDFSIYFFLKNDLLKSLNQIELLRSSNDIAVEGKLLQDFSNNIEKYVNKIIKILIERSSKPKRKIKITDVNCLFEEFDEKFISDCVEFYLEQLPGMFSENEIDIIKRNIGKIISDAKNTLINKLNKL